LAIILVTGENYLSNPFEFPEGVCEIREVFVYIRGPPGAEAFGSTRLETDTNFTAGKIVRTTLDDHDLFALALGIYYPIDFIALIDLASFVRFDVNWIWSAVHFIGIRGDDIASPQVHNGIATHAVLMRASMARKFLLYTDVRYSDDHVMTVLSSLCLCNSSFGRVRELRGAHLMKPLSVNPLPCSVIPRRFRCPHFPQPGNATFAILLPNFKRQYITRTFNDLAGQTRQGSFILVFQNRAYQTYDFRALQPLSPVPIQHVWLTNWNSFFFMTYLPMAFLPYDYVLKVDDDFFPRHSRAIEDWLNLTDRHPNSLIGTGPGYAPPACGNISFQTSHRQPDHVAWVVLYPTSSGKMLHRFRYFTLAGGEDIGIALTSSIECGFISRQSGGWVMVSDNLGQAKDAEIHAMVAAARNGRGIYISIYCHYIAGGYRSPNWRKIPDIPYVDIRWPLW
jgi:hypothetical protein